MVFLCCGCAAYRFGSESLYRPDVQTVYVPVFQSESFRRHLGERLTEAVCKQIEQRTPYKVVASERADSILAGRILQESKFGIVENINDELRDIELEILVEITWKARGGFVLLGPIRMPVTPEFQTLAQAVHFVPEAGQSLTTAQQELLNRMAIQIVELMESPW